MAIGDLSRRWTHKDQDCNAPRETAHDAHQRELKRLVAKRVSVWHRGVLFCDACGRALLVGERPRILRRDDDLLVACALCHERLYEEGCTHVAAGPVIGTDQELELVNQQELLGV